LISKTDVLIQSDCWVISCLLIEDADWLWDDFDICVFVNKQVVHIIKNCDDDVLEETVFDKEAVWIVAWELRSSCTFVQYVAEIVENNNISVLEKKAAETMKNNNINNLKKETAKAVSSNNNALDEKAA